MPMTFPQGSLFLQSLIRSHPIPILPYSHPLLKLIPILPYSHPLFMLIPIPILLN